MNIELSHLKIQLRSLRTDGGLVALKTGTEVEDMPFEDIELLRHLTDGLIPLFVKTGGPEARNDIRALAEIGVSGMIAPMIVSEYALRKFILTMRDILGDRYQDFLRGINLETIDGYRQMERMLAAPEALELHRITAARSDLSGSMRLEVDDPRVLEVAAAIVSRAREMRISTSVGGGLHPGIIQTILDRVKPDTINTRHMAISVPALRNFARPGEVLRRHLAFEADLYEVLARRTGGRQEAYAARSDTIRKRMENAALLKK